MLFWDAHEELSAVLGGFLAGRRRRVGSVRAIVITRPGGPEVLELTTVDDPRPGSGEVVLDVAATAVNRADLMQREGHYPPPPGASLLPGLEAAGTVAEVGRGRGAAGRWATARWRCCPAAATPSGSRCPPAS